MEKREWFGKNIKTSTLGFGCMRFKTKNGIVDFELAESLIDYAYQHGVNYFDTARVYLDGQSESVLGRALMKYPRDSFYIATKFSIWNFKSIDEVENMINEQLKELQTDYIDFYLLHAMNKSRLKKVVEFGVLDLLEKWKAQGKIKNIGFSFHDDFETFKDIFNLYKWDFAQIQFNYMDKDIQQGMEGYNMLVDANIPIIVMEPLKGGKLTKFNTEVENIYKEVNNDTMATWAFRWILSQKGIYTVLSGMNEMAQLEENVRIFDNFKPLNVMEEQTIKYATEKLKKLEIVGCTKCQYCMPCPFGVNIPQNFSIINEYSMYKNAGDFKWQINHLRKNKADFSYCVKCKKCVSKCPQFINIPEDLLIVDKIEKELLDGNSR